MEPILPVIQQGGDTAIIKSILFHLDINNDNICPCRTQLIPAGQITRKGKRTVRSVQRVVCGSPCSISTTCMLKSSCRTRKQSFPSQSNTDLFSSINTFSDTCFCRGGGRRSGREGGVRERERRFTNFLLLNRY